MTPESVVVVLPLPPRVLSPNVAQATLRGRFAKAAAAKKYRCLTKEAIQEERIETTPWGLIEVTPEFFHATKRRRDTDNAMTSLKPAYDGLVDAGLVEDDDPEHMRRMSPVFSIDRDNPRVVLAIVRVNNNES